MEARRMLNEAGSQSIRDESFTAQLVSKWGRFLEGVEDPYTKRVMSVLFENQWQECSRNLTEDTLSVNAGEYTKYIFPVLRRVFPNLIAQELVSVQPMSSPIGAVFYFEYKHGRNKGQTVAGSNLLQNFDRDYSSEYINGEQLALGDGAAYGGAAGTPLAVILQYAPVRPLDADVSLECIIEEIDATGAVVQTATDDGSGGFTFTPAGANTAGALNYETGQVTGFKFQNVAAAGNVIQGRYFYDSEANKLVPDVFIDIGLEPIKATTRKLKARWSSEASDDLRAFHGVDAETELVSGISQEIGLELDRDILNDLFVASAGITNTFDFTVPAGISEIDHIRSILTRMGNVSFQIHKQSRRAPANWYVTSPEIAARLVQLQTHLDYRPPWVSSPESPTGPFDGTVVPSSYGPATSHFGIARLGPLQNKWWGYQDPYFTFNQMLLGLRGESYLDAGYVFAPYVPLQITPTFLDPDDQTYRKGMRTRYAKKLLRSEWFGRVTVTGGL